MWVGMLIYFGNAFLFIYIFCIRTPQLFCFRKYGYIYIGLRYSVPRVLNIIQYPSPPTSRARPLRPDAPSPRARFSICVRDAAIGCSVIC
jgi:hypothetical protein